MQIVLIEDILPVSKMMTLVLSGAGHEVSVFNRAQPALAYLAAGHPCSLIITDYNLPDIDAADLVHTLAQTSPAPIVIYTGSAIGAVVIPPEHSHRTRLLEKPFQINTLLDVIRQIAGE